MLKKWDLVLSSEYSPEACTEKLNQQIDVDKRTLLSISGYRGTKPVVGRIDDGEFRLHWRRYWHNSFGPVLFGRISSQGGGSLVEGYWEMCKFARTSMRVWLVGAALIGIPIFFNSLKCATSATCADRDTQWIGLLVPSGMLLFGWLLPRLGMALGRNERRRIEALVLQTFAARPALAPSLEREWTCGLDDCSFWV